jgi:hypothetical protein
MTEFGGFCVCVLEVNDSEIQLALLHPSEPSKFFMYPSQPDILWAPPSKLLVKVEPETAACHMLSFKRDPVVLLRN